MASKIKLHKNGVSETRLIGKEKADNSGLSGQVHKFPETGDSINYWLCGLEK